MTSTYLLTPPPLVSTYSATCCKVLTPWTRAAAALRSGALDKFAAACWYFGESLADRLEQEAAAQAAGPNAAAAAGTATVTEKVPIGLIESAFGGTMIESWLPVASQLACANITCTANQTQRFTKDTAAACAAAAAAAGGSAGASAKGAGSNSELFNGMVSPFVDYTLKGWLWYQVGAGAAGRCKRRCNARVLALSLPAACRVAC